MSENKCVYYKKQPERLNASLKLDGDDDEIKCFSRLLSKHSGVAEEKIEELINNVGIDALIENPSLLCISKEQEEKIKEIGMLIRG
ncbi:MAG TPA: hypothetical protein PLF27_10290 [Sedimentibacter sp.]|nr:hypothetical protein [Sedimentibacter sp.]